jgi:hypothetical protein
MCQLKDVQLLYAFHFDSLPKNEHETRARFLPRSLEFPKRRNDYLARCQTGLFWIRNSELATDFARQQIGNLCVAWYRGDPARVGQIYILAVLPSFLGKNTIKSLQVPDQFPPFHLHLELLDHHFTLRKSR